ncbi:MAG: alpha/beta hydrolase [Tenericutes bacterium]|nr:alpha/beta hydrolase [Mycoplasmatota bacterium]
MKDPKIVYARGLWSHPKAVDWIANKLQEETDLPVELFDYHEELVSYIDNKTYMKRVTEKYGDTYAGENVILYGHSHGGTFAIIFNEKYGSKKLILSNECLRPYGILLKVPHFIKELLGNMRIGEGYKPHYEIKYESEVDKRIKYFTSHFDLKRDISRLLFVRKEAEKLAGGIKTDTLCIQSLKDEMASIKPNLQFYRNINLPEYQEGMITSPEIPTKQIIQVPDGEHAILKETGVYPRLYKSIGNFIRR